MILGSRKVFLRHTLVGTLAVLLVSLFWFSYLEQSGSKAALWRAFADTAFIFLFITLLIGPLTVLWEPALKVLTWRREFGIWFAILALCHGFLIVSGLFRWDVISTLSQGGLGLANLMGATALFFALILAVTSSDMAVKFLGISSWKWLHTLSYVIFYLVGFHAIHNLFISPLSPEHWFRYIFLIMLFAVPILQLSAFIKIVSSNRKRLNENKVKSK